MSVSAQELLDTKSFACVILYISTSCIVYYLLIITSVPMHGQSCVYTCFYCVLTPAGLCCVFVNAFFPLHFCSFLPNRYRVKSDLPKVHRQLALSLLLTDITFLIGVDRQAVPSPDGLCTTFAAVLHYLLLVTFTWMLIEGVHIFIMIVIVFFSKKVYIVYYFIGWGLPLIIVGITLGVRFCDYGSTAL